MTVLQTEKANRFRTAGSAYCALIDSRAEMLPVRWLQRVHSLLPELYAAALALPEIAPDTNGAGQSSTTHDQWHALYSDLGGMLGRWNYYWDVFDPYHDTERDAVCGSLADDLADIYRDVHDGLLAERTVGDTLPNDVMWDWRFSFVSHWAAHATGALRALSTLFFVHHAEEFPETFTKPTGSAPLAS